MKEEAIKYLSKDGYREALSIIPLSGKNPFKNSHGYKDATKDKKQIEKWWTEHPRANIGIATGKINNLLVIDVDIKHDQGKYGDESLRDLEKELGELPKTWTVITGSGGLHYYFKYPEGHEISISASQLGECLDIRANGGYVVAPPSIHPETGRVYEWEGGSDPEETPLASLPQKWIERLTGKKSKEEKKEPFVLPEKVTKGARNETMFHYGASLRANKVSATKTLELMEQANRERIVPPLNDWELRRIYDSVMTYKSGTAVTEFKYEEGESPNLDQFHTFNQKGEPSGVFDYAIREYLKEKENIFILGKVPYIYQNGVFRADTSGSNLTTMIESLLYPKFIKAPITKRIYELFIMDATLQVTPGELNDFPKEWINFKNGFYDPLQKKMIPHDPKYKAVNQIPHEYDPKGELSGEMVQSWLRFICNDPEDVEMLLQYSGLCLTRDTRQQKFLILNGEGGTGKSTVIRMIDRMIGEENISNISLNQLTQRFFSYGLMGKLLNSCADLELDALSDVSTLKKVLGEDTLSGEAKGKDAVSFKSYAKLIFSTNELPIVKAERTNGFYRRLLILTMDRVPEKKETDFFDRLAAEIGDFIRLSVEALERMYQTKQIKESRNSIEAVKRMRCDSDTVEAFLSDCVERVPDGTDRRVKKSEMFVQYISYCEIWGRQSQTKQNFYRSMRSKGFGEIKGSDGHEYFRGARLKDSAKSP